jgi:hypothetical protein
MSAETLKLKKVVVPGQVRRGRYFRVSEYLPLFEAGRGEEDIVPCFP